jgi:hypothetical protein
MKKESVYFEYEELPAIPQDVTPVDTHLDKQLEYIKKKGIFVEEDHLQRIVTNKLYAESIDRTEKETNYFINLNYNTGFIITESSVSGRSKHLLIKGKEKATLIANRLNLYHDIMIRAYELGYEPFTISEGKSVYGLRYDFDNKPTGKLYVAVHYSLQVFIFGIYFSEKEPCKQLLDEFGERIKMYY